MEQGWFEMRDIRKRRLNEAVWIPLRASQTISELGELGYEGYKTEFFGAVSVAMPVLQKDLAHTIEWSELNLTHSSKGYVEQGHYIPAEVVKFLNIELDAISLVLVQDGNAHVPEEWDLNQDFTLSLNLKREGDKWVAVDEDFIEVARLLRKVDRPILLEVRAEFLKDYLCARWQN